MLVTATLSLAAIPAAKSAVTARAGSRRFGLLSALRAHTESPHTTGFR